MATWRGGSNQSSKGKGGSSFGKGKGRSAAFPDVPWTNTFVAIKSDFLYDNGAKEATWIMADDFSQAADGNICLGNCDTVSHWVELGIYTHGPCAAVMDATK